MLDNLVGVIDCLCPLQLIDPVSPEHSAVSTVLLPLCTPCCTQPAANRVLLSLCTPSRHTDSSQYSIVAPLHNMQAHSQQPVWYCCPCAHHTGTQPAVSMVLLSLCTTCRLTTSSQYGTSVPVHNMQVHSQQQVWYCCPCAQHAGTPPAVNTVLLSLCTPCRHTASSQYGTAVPVHTMKAHNQKLVWYFCPCTHHAGTQPAASTVLLSLCTTHRHTAAVEVQIHPVITSTLWTPAVLSLGREPPVPTEEVGWIPELVWMQLAASHQLTVRIINPYNVLCTALSPTRTRQAIGWSCTVHVISHQPLTTEVQIQSQDRQCGICGGQTDSQTPSLTTLRNHHDWQYHSGTSFRKAQQTPKISFLSFRISLSCKMYFLLFRYQLILIRSSLAISTYILQYISSHASHCNTCYYQLVI